MWILAESFDGYGGSSMTGRRSGCGTAQHELQAQMGDHLSGRAAKRKLWGGGLLELLWREAQVSYDADRILLVRKDGEKKKCGCGSLIVNTLKDRTSPTNPRRFKIW